MTEDEWIDGIHRHKQAVNRLRAQRDDAAEAQKQAIDAYNLAQLAYTESVHKMQDYAQMENWTVNRDAAAWHAGAE